MFVFRYMNTTSTLPFLGQLGALGDETRTRILALLNESELTVSELARVLQLPQPNVSRHLKSLTSDGWLQVRAEGRSRHYRLSTELDVAAREIWTIVRSEIDGEGVYAVDAERSRAVLSERRRRSDAFFAATAEGWDELRAELFGSGAGLAPLLGLLDTAWTAVDLGCGTGGLTETLAPHVSRVIGIDRSPEMLAAAEARLQDHPNVELRRGELEHLPVADDAADLAVLGLVLHYVADPFVALCEARRVLRPGGRLILVDMRPHDRGPAYSESMGHAWPGFGRDQVTRWMVEAGFARQRVVDLPPDPEATGPLLFLATAT